MSNIENNSETHSNLNPTDKFEEIFLIIPSDEPISNLQEINEKTAYGTGFFIDKNGLFLSVAHNFPNRYNYFYLLLKDNNGNHNLVPIERDTNFILDEECDYAIGKIDQQCDFLYHQLYQQQGHATIKGLKNKKLHGVPHSQGNIVDLDDIDTILPTLPIPIYNNIYYSNNSIEFYHITLDIKIAENIGFCNWYKTNHDFNYINYENSAGNFVPFGMDSSEFALSGLSGSPIFNKQGKVIAIHRGNDSNEFTREIFNYNMISVDDRLVNFINTNKGKF